MMSLIARHVHDIVGAPSGRRWDAFIDKGRRTVARLWTKGNVIFKFHPDIPAIVEFPVEQSRHYTASFEIEESIFATIPEYIKESMELFWRQGASCWLAKIDERCACVLWTIQRNQISDWHLPIEPSDLVIYGVVTVSDFRGQAIAARLSRRAALEAHGSGVAVYLDTKSWNLAAQRAFGKAGFVPVATIRGASKQSRAPRQNPRGLARRN